MIKTMFLFCSIMLMTFSCASNNSPTGDIGDDMELPSIDKPPVDNALDPWDGISTQEVVPSGNTYEVSHPDELAWITEQSGGGETFTGKTIKFTSDINMNNKAFNGLATFAGIIDGGSKILYGLNIDKSIDNTGFISILADGGEIFNLAIADSVIKGVNNVGAFVGKSTGNTIISGAVNSKTTVTGSGDAIGGIIGFVNDSITIEDTASSGPITGVSYVGGIIGIANGNTTLVNVGNLGPIIGTANGAAGIIGGTNPNATINISKAGNSGSVTGGNYVAGIIGYNSRSNATPTTTIIEETTNYGDITGIGSVSGIIAYTIGATIENVGNSGTIKATGKYVGGIVGYIGGSRRKNSTVSIKHTYNYTLLIANTATEGEKGAIIGAAAAVQSTIIINDSYFLDTTSDGSYSSTGNNAGHDEGNGATEISLAEFSTQSTFTGWDFSIIWNMDDLYPILK